MAFDAYADQIVAERSAPDGPLDDLQRRTQTLVHDLNNLLTVVFAANEMLASSLAKGSEARALIETSQAAAEQGADLLGKLLDISSRNQGGRIDCGSAVASAARLARLSTPAAVTIDVQTPETPLWCRGDQGGLNAALLNLCVNAGHAMSDGGQIAISAKRAGAEAIAALGLPVGRYVGFTVRDTGVGMSEAMLARAQEPFFTTRKAQGGSGLGLPSVQGFARDHGGALSLKSRPGCGTIATLYLPRA